MKVDEEDRTGRSSFFYSTTQVWYRMKKIDSITYLEEGRVLREPITF